MGGDFGDSGDGGVGRRKREVKAFAFLGSRSQTEAD